MHLWNVLIMKRRAQRDSNPRPTAPQAAILSKLNYGPSTTYFLFNKYMQLLALRMLGLIRKSNSPFLHKPQLKPRCADISKAR